MALYLFVNREANILRGYPPGGGQVCHGGPGGRFGPGGGMEPERCDAGVCRTGPHHSQDVVPDG